MNQTKVTNHLYNLQHFFEKTNKGILMISEVKQHLLEPELMLMLSAGRLLQAVALASSLACSQILETCVPMLIETYNKQTEVRSGRQGAWLVVAMEALQGSHRLENYLNFRGLS